MIKKVEDALEIVYSCAREYKKNLLGKNLLFVFTDKHRNIHCVETAFDARHFQHLTGLKTDKSKILSVDFFNRCIDQRLSPKDIEFAKDGTTPLKLAVLPNLMKSNLSVKMIGDYNNSQPKLMTERIAGNIAACIGFIKDKSSGEYVPNTVLEGDIRDKVLRTDRIVLIYRKDRYEKKYSEIVYQAKKVEWAALQFPEEYCYLPIPQIE